VEKRVGIIIAVLLGVFLLSGVAFAWQGRMAGMGDPYGLVQDESDFLINPAKIADGQNIKYYGNYKFTFGDVTDLKFDTVTPQFGNSTLKDASGTEYQHEVLIGSGFPVGNGRMGIFFSYAGNRSSFDGNTAYAPIPFSSEFDMQSEFDNFALRLLYGQSLCDGTNVGGEIQIAHQREENRFTNTLFVGGTSQISLTNDFLGNLLPFMLPYDTSYWEVLAKVGVDGNVGPAKVGLTLRGGSIFSGNNEWSGSDQSNFFPGASFGTSGGVDGWKIGTDLWVRYPYSESVTLPFIIRVDYSDKSRNGTGTMGAFFGLIDPPFVPLPNSVAFGTNSILGYNSSDRSLQIEAGGGVDILLSKTTRVAAGLYYDYVNVKSDMAVTFSDQIGLMATLNYGSMPDRTEHLARFKLAGETPINAQWTFRGGMDVFGGFAREELGADNFYGSTRITTNGSMDGTHWGITGFVGATTRLYGATVEPFIQAGYQEYSVSDGGAQSSFQGFNYLSDLDKSQKQAVVGAGVSILF
jgi:hypothetical protein